MESESRKIHDALKAKKTLKVVLKKIFIVIHIFAHSKLYFFQNKRKKKKARRQNDLQGLKTSLKIEFICSIEILEKTKKKNQKQKKISYIHVQHALLSSSTTCSSIVNTHIHVFVGCKR